MCVTNKMQRIKTARVFLVLSGTSQRTVTKQMSPIPQSLPPSQPTSQTGDRSRYKAGVSANLLACSPLQRGTVGTGLQTASPEESERYAMHPSMMVFRRAIDTAYALPLPLTLTTVLVEQSGGSTTENANKQTRHTE